MRTIEVIYKGLEYTFENYPIFRLRLERVEGLNYEVFDPDKKQNELSGKDWMELLYLVRKKIKRGY